MKENGVLVLGSIAYDCIETIYASEDYILGGSASFASLACSYFAKAKILGIVGKDFKNNDIQRLLNRGIDIEGLEVDKSQDTFFWRGKYHENFNRRDTLDVRLNVFANYTPKLPDNLKNSKIALLGNIHPALQMHTFNQLKNPEFVALDSMDLWINTAHKDLLDIMKKVDLLIINDSEAELLSDEKNIYKAGEKILAMGPKNLIIKKGEHGAILFHKDGIFVACAHPVVDLRDPTGAGDSFAGSLVGCLAKDNSLSFDSFKKAVIYGSAVASLTVESFSCTKLEDLGFDEVQKRFEYIKKISSI